MNENIERVLDELDGFRMADEMTYSAYSRLHDLISELDDLLKAQEPIEPIEEIDYESDADGEERPYSMYYCRKCKEYIEIDQKYCDHCGQAVKWK